jgi:GNAT superfamily N-acetyltransferase
MIRIRRADRDDVTRDVIFRGEMSCFPADTPYVLKSNHAVWLAHAPPNSLGDTLAGYAAMVEHGPAAGFLARCGVLPAYRGQGLQRRLIRARVAHARRIGLKTVYTYTIIRNPASSNNLIKSGFALYRPEWRWAGVDCLYWRLDL